MPTNKQYTKQLVNTALGTILQGVPYSTQSKARSRTVSSQNIVTTKRKRRTSKNSFSAKLMSVTPAKHMTGTMTATILHDQIWSFNATAAIGQGDGNTNRNGDFVHLAAIKLKGFFNAAATAGAYSYRIMVGYTGEEYGATSLSSSALTDVELFLPNTTSSFRVAGLVNPKAFTCLYDETIDVNSEIAGTLSLQSYAFTVQLDKKFPYQASGSVYGKDKNLMVVVIGSVAGGSVGVTPAGGCTLSYDLIFKDI